MIRTGRWVPALFLGGVLLWACESNPVEPDQMPLSATDADLAVQTGEQFSYLAITSPTRSTHSLRVGATVQMSATLFFDRGGFLPSEPYAQWRSTDECVATVTNAHPNWGSVRGVRSGTTHIIAEAWGRADTVTVTVRGSGDLNPGCSEQQWVWDFDDVSFTGTPSRRNTVVGGERLERLVLYAGPKPDYTLPVGGKQTLRSELWYDRGGRLNGAGFVTFTTTDPSVATIDSRGVVTALKAGRTKVIARLGSDFSDAVPLYVIDPNTSVHPCHDPLLDWDFDDVSFTGKPAQRNTVVGGERLQRLVLFAGPEPDCSIPVGGTVTLRSELQYDRGGTLNGAGFVNFVSTDPSVATVNSRGVVTGRSSGRTRIIVRLGTNFSDEVPLYVR